MIAAYQGFRNGPLLNRICTHLVPTVYPSCAHRVPILCPHSSLIGCEISVRTGALLQARSLANGSFSKPGLTQRNKSSNEDFGHSLKLPLGYEAFHPVPCYRRILPVWRARLRQRHSFLP